MELFNSFRVLIAELLVCHPSFLENAQGAPVCVRERTMLSVKHVSGATAPSMARLRIAAMTVMTSLHTLP